MKPKYSVALLVFFSIIVSVACGYLAKQNNSYRTENRSLLLQNDSLLSINLGLINELRKYKKDSYSRITKNP